MNSESLPVPVTQHPHWRVRIKPLEYGVVRADSLQAGLDLIRKCQVQLRGWYYPHISNKPDRIQLGNNWVGSWSDFTGHIEYWRYYQSGQFLHLFDVEETILTEWRDQLRGNLVGLHGGDENEPAGYLSIDNFLYTVSEIFEFAARLSTRAEFGRGTSISIRLTGIQDYALSFTREHMINRYTASIDVLEHEWSFRLHELAADPANAAIEAVRWFFERFGWLKQPLSSFRLQQKNFLQGR